MGIIKTNKNNTMSLVKDNGFSLNGSYGGVSGGIKFADNSLTCDSEGNCMLKDHLATNALTCDSEGNCMLKDKLISFGGSIGKFSANVSTADNALTCDSEGNCMLKDSLMSIKDKIAADIAAANGGLSIKQKIAQDIAKETEGMSIKEKIAADIAKSVATPTKHHRRPAYTPAKPHTVSEYKEKAA